MSSVSYAFNEVGLNTRESLANVIERGLFMPNTLGAAISQNHPIYERFFKNDSPTINGITIDELIDNMTIVPEHLTHILKLILPQKNLAYLSDIAKRDIPNRFIFDIIQDLYDSAAEKEFSNLKLFAGEVREKLDKKYCDETLISSYCEGDNRQMYFFDEGMIVAQAVRMKEFSSLKKKIVTKLYELNKKNTEMVNPIGDGAGMIFYSVKDKKDQYSENICRGIYDAICNLKDSQGREFRKRIHTEKDRFLHPETRYQKYEIEQIRPSNTEKMVEIETTYKDLKGIIIPEYGIMPVEIQVKSVIFASLDDHEWYKRMENSF